MNKKLLTAAPPLQGGCSENSAKLQRGGKTSGLTCLDNCLINSDIDFPLLSSQFKDIQLQLHATKVTNPYTFSIQGNKSFSGICVGELPSTETYLYNKLVTEVYESIYETIKISIPPNCKVLKVDINVSVTVENSDGENLGYVQSIIKNTSNNINWVYEYSDSTVYGDTAYINIIKYVGVTPNKTYTLSLDLNTSADYEVGTSYISCKISYSSDINSHSVDIKDY